MNPSKLLFSALAMALTSLSACNADRDGSRDESAAESVETGHAQLLLGASGDRPVTLKITAYDEVDGHTALQKTIELNGNEGTHLDVALPVAVYTIDVQVFARGDSTQLLGKVNTFASIEANYTKQIKLLTTVNDEGVASVSTDVNATPQIQNVRVTPQNGAVDVTVQAADQDGDPLVYLWSGTGLDGVLSGASNLHLPVEDKPGAENVNLHVLVVDSHGAVAATTIKVLLPPQGAPGMTSKEPTEQCINTHAGCVTACDAKLGLGLSAAEILEHSTCEAKCNSALTACEEP